MIVKSFFAVGLLTGLMFCGSCGQDGAPANGQSHAKTLAGTADASKNTANQKGELRLPDAPVERSTAQSAGATAAAPQTLTPSNASAARPADVSDVPLAPKDAQWTIYCATIKGDSHVELSRGLKTKLIQQSGMREWYILHESDRSRVYYGFYRSIADKSDAAETARAQADRKKIEEMKDSQNLRPFQACQFVQLNSPDPEAPSEWNLLSAPEDKVWTLMIGAYKDSPDRKKAAVDAVRDARARGLEAYYYHGETVSNVFVGTWPAEAMQEERFDTDPARRGNNRDPLIVLPSGVNTPGKVTDKAGNTVRAVSVKLVPVDESLKKMISEYPYMGVNGDMLVYKSRNGQAQQQGSMVIQIPRPLDNLPHDAGTQQQAADGRGPDANDSFSHPGAGESAAKHSGSAQPQQTTDPAATGRLRSIGK